MENLNIPTGHTHRSVLIERGWNSGQIDEHLPMFVKIDAPAGVSNKAYADEDVAKIEAGVPEIRKAVAARADLIPTSGPYDEANTISRAALVGRGWTPAHIKRLLGAPDAYGYGAQNESHRYGIDRVEWAEANDAKLVKRLAQVAKKKAAALTAKVENDGEIIFRRIDGEWMLEGMDLIEGEEVTVSKKDGSTTTAVVGEIVSDSDGRRVARVARKPRQADAPTRDIEAEYVAMAPTPAPTTHRPAIVLTYKPRVGSTITINGKKARVLSARAEYIDSDTPSVYGSHLLGHEDEWGAYVEYEMI